MTGEEFGGFLAGAALVAFGVFIYFKIKASKTKKSTGSGGGTKKEPFQNVEK